MSDWLALSDRTDPPAPDTRDDALIWQGLFVMELALPLDGATVLLDHQSGDRTISVFHDLAAGLVILHRQGRDLRRHVLPGPLPQDASCGRLTFGFGRPGPNWTLRFETETGSVSATSGTGALPIRLEDMRALASGGGGRGGLRHPAVLWFGLTKGTAPPEHAPWIGLRTPIDTPKGPVLADHLRPGDLVTTLDQGTLPVLALRRMVLPARGNFAPVLLRAPYFGQRADLLVSADQLLGLSGAEVEYLFGEDEVLVPAGYLVDGRAALSDQRRTVAACLQIELGAPALVTADGCALMTAASAPGLELPCRLLQGFEAPSLLSLLGRASLRRSA